MIVLLMVVNPGYLTQLVPTGLGRGMLLTGGVLLLVGTLWLRSVVE